VSERYQTTDGIVIRRHEMTNGDVIVTLLSNHGKWRAKAKKGKKIGGNVGKLSLFHDVTVQYYKKSDEDIVLLTQVQLNGALPHLSQPNVYPYAHILAELVDALTVDHQHDEQLYSYFASGLRGLNQHDDAEAVAIIYAWKLLQQAGLAPQLKRCTCGKNSMSNTFDVASGGMSCTDCHIGMPLTENTITDLQFIHHQSLKQAIEAPLANREQHWSLLYRYITYHVNELKSLNTFLRLSKEPSYA
jgi:DNA repair protein RecO (recombination protein O)